jgi:hypothetical protein
MKCLKCGGMEMLRCKHTCGGIYWTCPRCNSTVESTSNSEDKPVNYNFPKFECSELIDTSQTQIFK